MATIKAQGGGIVEVGTDLPYYYDKQQRRLARERDRANDERRKAMPKRKPRKDQKHGPVSVIDVRSMNLTRDYMMLDQ